MHDATTEKALAAKEFNAAEIGAIAHLYRGEVYRSTIWRTRLDNTTNWSVVTLGIALSITFSSNEATPLPLLLVGVLVVGFLGLEARRYRYFNVWRARSRWMETHFYAPLLRGEGITRTDNWQGVLALDYCEPRYHISYARAFGRRLRRNYGWIFVIQGFAYYGKVAVHPTPIGSWNDLWDRAAIGPIPGQLLVVCGVAFYSLLAIAALWTLQLDRVKHRDRKEAIAMG
jgi:uncharacterized membrane protein